MKNVKTAFLTLILSVGFLLPSCEKNLSITGCEGAESHRYFDIKGFHSFYFKKDVNGGFEPILTDSIAFSDFGGIFMEYEVDYHAAVTSFSLIGSTLACSYIAGYGGSKTEQLNDLSVITLNDFDEAHLANSSINDLLVVDNIWMVVDSTWTKITPIELTEFLANQTENIPQPYLTLQLNKAPELNPEIQFKITVELSTGEIYEAESIPIFIKE